MAQASRSTTRTCAIAAPSDTYSYDTSFKVAQEHPEIKTKLKKKNQSFFIILIAKLFKASKKMKAFDIGFT